MQLNEVNTIFHCKGNISVLMDFHSDMSVKQHVLEMVQYAFDEKTNARNIVKGLVLSSSEEQSYKNPLTK